MEKGKNLQFFKQFVLKNSETRFQNPETHFQNAETRFENAKTALSRIFFARTGMDSAQKKPDLLPFKFVNECTIFTTAQLFQT